MLPGHGKANTCLQWRNTRVNRTPSRDPFRQVERIDGVVPSGEAPRLRRGLHLPRLTWLRQTTRRTPLNLVCWRIQFPPQFAHVVHAPCAHATCAADSNCLRCKRREGRVTQISIGCAPRISRERGPMSAMTADADVTSVSTARSKPLSCPHEAAAQRLRHELPVPLDRRCGNALGRF